jgi:uncharacterized SAM-binding protein YcdF (DUF218 family)
MFFTLSKITAFLLSPLTWIMVLLLLGLITAKATRKKILLWAAAVLFYLFANPFLTDELVRLWETEGTDRQHLFEKYEAGVVLGAGMATVDKSTGKITFRHNGDRIFQALDLYHSGKIGKIILSGGSGSMVFRDVLEADLVRQFLLDLGYPPKDIVAENRSRNTYDNARYTADMLEKEHPGKKVLLITSALHMRRAEACFKKQGIAVLPFVTEKIAGPRRYDFAHLFIPDVDNLKNLEDLIHEVAGYLAYRVMGYL